MTNVRSKLLGLGIIALAVYTGLPSASSQAPQAPSPARAQDQPFPPGSPFALLPGFKIDRVTPADKTESYIVVTFDAIGRPVVSQSSSGNGVAPRVLLDENGDGLFEGEKIIAPQLNTCHGLFYASRTTLYANCRAELPGDPPVPAGGGRGGGGGGGQAPAAAPAPGAPAAAGAPAGQAGAAAQAGRGAGQAQPAAVGIAGFYKLEDTNGDDVMDTIVRLQRYVSAGMGDHGPHAIRRAPDGSVMLLIGNNTYVGEPFPANQPTDAAVDKAASPNWHNVGEERQFLPQFNDPRFGNSTRLGVHATVWRLQPDNRVSLFYSGMRNPYDFAFNLAGEAFTFDSDMEWDVNAPWYREVRTVHMIPGGDAGYRNGTGKFQDEYFDALPALRHLRRGSPVGVETYQSYAYPASFFDNLFEADWSRGRLLYTALTPAGGTYTGREDLAEFVHGEPMPITDMEVGPDGNMYLTTGGAAGQGGLYRVSWTGTRPTQPDMTGILAVVRQPQPLSSFGWAAIERAKASMGARFATELEALARNATAATRDRVQAVLELQRHDPANRDGLLQALVKDRQAEVRAAAVYVASLHRTDAAKAVAASALKDTSAFVQRRAAEAIVRQGLTASSPSFAPVGDVYALLRSPDRFVRYAGRLALEHTPRATWMPMVFAETNVVALTEGLLAIANTMPAVAQTSDAQAIFDKLIPLMARTTLPVDERIRVLRTFEVTVAQLPAGSVTDDVKTRVHAALIKQMPAAPPAGTWTSCTSKTAPAATCNQYLLVHHLAKVLAHTGKPDVVTRIFAVMPPGDEDQPGQIDLMYSLQVIDSGWASNEKERAISWYAKASKWRGGSTFAGHVLNIFEATVDAFTEAEKQQAYKAAPAFAPMDPTLAPAPTAAPAAAAAAAAPGAPAGPGRGAGPGGGGGGGGRGRGPSNPLDRNERYENLVFPRGGGPGSLTGRGGGPNATDGERVFREACAQCHKFGTVGQTYAPDLTKVAGRLPRRDILRAIFFPSEAVDPKFTATVLVMRDGTTVRGLLLSETPQNVVLKTASPEPTTILKSNIGKRTTERVSVMPDDLIDTVGDNGIRDVVAYLMQTGK